MIAHMKIVSVLIPQAFKTDRAGELLTGKVVFERREEFVIEGDWHVVLEGRC